MKIVLDQHLSTQQQKLVTNWVNQTLLKLTELSFSAGLELHLKAHQLAPEFATLNGITGYCPTANLISIGLDFSYPKLNKVNFQLTLVHELYHAHQRQQGIKAGEGDLRETLLNEGLADLYCEKIMGRTPIWTKRFQPTELTRLTKLASKEYELPTTQKRYERWFTKGSVKDDIPVWAGYAIGYQLAINKLQSKQ